MHKGHGVQRCQGRSAAFLGIRITYKRFPKGRWQLIFRGLCVIMLDFGFLILSQKNFVRPGTTTFAARLHGPTEHRAAAFDTVLHTRPPSDASDGGIDRAMLQRTRARWFYDPRHPVMLGAQTWMKELDQCKTYARYPTRPRPQRPRRRRRGSVLMVAPLDQNKRKEAGLRRARCPKTSVPQLLQPNR